MARSRVIVEFPDRPAYDVRIGTGIAEQLAADLQARAVDPGACLVLCDTESAARCLPTLKETLKSGGFAPTSITVPALSSDDVWECVGELHRAFGSLGMADGVPFIVCAGAQASQAAVFACATWGRACPLVLVPSSLAAVYAVVGVDGTELDAGCAAALYAPIRPLLAVVDDVFIATTDATERLLGDDELKAAAILCDEGFQQWLRGACSNAQGLDADSLVLAIAQTLAARADAIGAELRQ